jgi:hypothetical protein
VRPRRRPDLGRRVRAVLPPARRDPLLDGDELVWHVGSHVVRLPVTLVNRVACARTPYVGDELVLSGGGASVRIRLIPQTEQLRHDVGRRLVLAGASVAVSADARQHLGLA